MIKCLNQALFCFLGITVALKTAMIQLRQFIWHIFNFDQKTEPV